MRFFAKQLVLPRTVYVETMNWGNVRCYVRAHVCMRASARARVCVCVCVCVGLGGGGQSNLSTEGFSSLLFDEN
jgi:hypothetical protein